MRLGIAREFLADHAKLEKPVREAVDNTFGKFVLISQEPVDLDGSAPSAGKYQPLTDWLRAQSADRIPVSFEDLADILGASLPPSARNHLPYWYSSSNSLGKAIVAVGFKASGANLTAERVVLARR